MFCVPTIKLPADKQQNRSKPRLSTLSRPTDIEGHITLPTVKQVNATGIAHKLPTRSSTVYNVYDVHTVPICDPVTPHCTSKEKFLLAYKSVRMKSYYVLHVAHSLNIEYDNLT